MIIAQNTSSLNKKYLSMKLEYWSMGVYSDIILYLKAGRVLPISPLGAIRDKRLCPQPPLPLTSAIFRCEWGI